MKISLHKILEEYLGIGKIKNKEELEKLLADEERPDKVVEMIKNTADQAGQKEESAEEDDKGLDMTEWFNETD